MFLGKIAKIVILATVMVSMTLEVSARNNGSKSFDWNPVMDAITQVESEGNANAVSGNCCGAMQIRPILVEDCNQILSMRGEKKRYTLKDRFNIKKSREMFVLIMSHYNPENNVERAIRLWNGGVRYKAKSTQKYYQKVLAQMKR